MTKKCSKCKEDKNLTDFHKNKSKKDGLQIYCKPCMIQSTTKYIQSDAGKATQKKYYTSEIGKVHRRAREKKYNKTAKGIANNKKQCSKRWYADHEHSKLKLRARNAGVPLGVLKQIQERDKVCQLCHTDQDLQFDHIYPVSLGGLGSLDNLQLLCGTCNNFKSNNLFLPDGGMMLTGKQV